MSANVRVSHTYRRRGPGWHVKHMTACLFTAGLWAPVYMWLWRRPETVTVYGAANERK